MLLVPVLERAGAEHVCPGWEGRSRLAALEEDLRTLGMRSNAKPVLALIRKGAGNLGRPLCRRGFSRVGIGRITDDTVPFIDWDLAGCGASQLIGSAAVGRPLFEPLR
jgi:hypothetical protein